jgi:hypothetical protein
MQAMLSSKLTTKQKDYLEDLQHNLTTKFSAVKEVLTALKTGKFQQVGDDDDDDDIDDDQRSETSTNLASLTSTIDDDFKLKGVQKRPHERLFQIEPMERVLYLDYTKELEQYLRAEKLLRMEKWEEAAAMYAIALKKTPRRGHKLARDSCLEKRAFCFSNMEAERQKKEEEDRKNEESMVEHMICGK